MGLHKGLSRYDGRDEGEDQLEGPFRPEDEGRHQTAYQEGRRHDAKDGEASFGIFLLHGYAGEPAELGRGKAVSDAACRCDGVDPAVIDESQIMKQQQDVPDEYAREGRPHARLAHLLPTEEAVERRQDHGQDIHGEEQGAE